MRRIKGKMAEEAGNVKRAKRRMKWRATEKRGKNHTKKPQRFSLSFRITFYLVAEKPREREPLQIAFKPAEDA